MQRLNLNLGNFTSGMLSTTTALDNLNGYTMFLAHRTLHLGQNPANVLQ